MSNGHSLERPEPMEDFLQSVLNDHYWIDAGGEIGEVEVDPDMFPHGYDFETIILDDEDDYNNERIEDWEIAVYATMNFDRPTPDPYIRMLQSTYVAEAEVIVDKQAPQEAVFDVLLDRLRQDARKHFNEDEKPNNPNLEE